MGKVLDVQCPRCKAPVKFNAKLGKMKCEYCDYEFTAEEVKQDVNQEEIQEESEGSYVNYNCPDCGAEIIADENTSATFCLYCGNTSIIKSRLNGKFSPSMILPFKKEKEEAIAAFKSLRKGRPFMPKFFNNEENIEKITGLYIPFWLYNVNVDGYVRVEGTKVKTWQTGSTHYTKTDYYDVIRGGNMQFSRIPVDGSKRFDNDIMNTIEPYDYKDMVKFNHAYLSGYLAEKYDVDSEEAFDDARKRALNSSKEVMMDDMHYGSRIEKENTLDIVKKEDEYVLLPVWMVNVKYNGEYYLFAMNGQTGEFVGNIPLDKRKVIIWGISIFVGIMLIVFVVSFVFYMMGGV